MATHTWEGTTKWFKALGNPVDNFNKDGKEWSFQISVGAPEKLLFRQSKIKKHIKFDEDLGDFVTVSLAETDKKGNTNKAPRVEDDEGNEWPSDKWIGNGSTIKTTCRLEPFSFMKDGQKIEGTKLIPTKVVVVNHVPYQAKGKTASKPAKRTDDTNWTDDDE